MNYQDYYNDYARDVWKRKGYPARARYKARILFRFSSEMIGGDIHSIADIGGCYGYCLDEFRNIYQRKYSNRCSAIVYELGKDYIEIGPTLFPDIKFLHSDNIGDEEFDLVLLCDVLEHVENYDDFLSRSSVGKYVLIWSPIEMGFLRRLAIFLRLVPIMKKGVDNLEGHVNFWGVRETIQIVSRHFRILGVGYESHRSMTEKDGIEQKTTTRTLWESIKSFIKRLVKWLPERFYVTLVGGHLMILGQTFENSDLEQAL